MKNSIIIISIFFITVTINTQCKKDNSILPFLGWKYGITALGDRIVTSVDTPVQVVLKVNNLYMGKAEFFIDAMPANGKLEQSPISNNVFTYTPASGYSGSDSIVFYATYGRQVSNEAVIAIQVRDFPVAYDSSVSTPTDTPLDITLNADGVSLSYFIETSPSHGSLEQTPGNPAHWTYTPEAGYIGNDSFTFYVYDGFYSSNIAGVDIIVGITNTPPVANDVSVQTDEDYAVVITLDGSDADNNPLEYEIIQGPAHGTLGDIFNTNQCQYTPDENFNGSDSFTYRVNDGYSDSNIATVEITVQPVNDPPVPGSDPMLVAVPFGGTITFPLDVSDQADEDYNLTSVKPPMQPPTSGTLERQGEAGCTWKYTHTGSDYGQDYARIEVLDTNGGSCVVNITFVIVPTNVIFVDASVPFGGDGTCWETAFNSIADAVDAANPATLTQIWVAQGTYVPRDGDSYVVWLRENVKIYGGFDGYEWSLLQRDNNPASNGAILDGNGTAYHVISAYDPNATPGACTTGNCVIDGFTVQGGKAEGSNLLYEDSGGGMLIKDSSPTVQNCIFIDNSATLNGGGICVLDESSPLITQCAYRNNEAGYDGGGLYIRNPVTGNMENPDISNCNFMSNSAGFDGGGLYTYVNTNATVDNCIFTNNSAVEYGGGICNYGISSYSDCRIENNNAGIDGGGLCDRIGQSTFTDSIISYNEANNNGGGVFLYSQSIFSGCNINGNSAVNGAGLFIEWGSNVVFENTIFNVKTISNNIASNNGGAIYSRGPFTLRDDFTISGNNALNGAGIYLAPDGIMTVENWSTDGCAFTGNIASQNGGGIYYAANPATIGPSTFEGNYAGNEASPGSGGGIYLNSGISLTLNAVDFISNNAYNDGGGVYSAGSLVLSDSFTISNNNAANGAGLYVNTGSVLDIQSCTTADCVFTGNIASQNGGGIYYAANPAAIGACTFEGNSAGNSTTPGSGGGIYINSDTSLTLNAVNFISNTTNNDGGGIYSAGSLVLGGGFTVDGNSAANGAGLYVNTGSALEIQNCSTTDCAFTENDATQNGGGIYLGSGTGLTLNAIEFISNTANNNGGGMYAARDITLESCRFYNGGNLVGNSATVNGGALYIDAAASNIALGIAHSIFSKNSAANGGGIFSYTGTDTDTGTVYRLSGTMVNTLIINNVATNNGGGIYNPSNCNHEIWNCTFSDNTAANGHSVYNYYNGFGACTPLIKNCIIWKNVVDESEYIDMIYNESGAAPLVWYSDIQMAGEDVVYPDPNNDPDNNTNIKNDPYFTSKLLEPFGAYYLRQTLNPCVNGGDPATDSGIKSTVTGGRTTDVGGGSDDDPIDMGYHYEQ